MEELTRGYEIEYVMPMPLIMTTLVKGEPLRKVYSGSGGYSSQDSPEFIEFMHQIANNRFPSGVYVVHGIADFDVSDDTYEPIKALKLDAYIQFWVK